MSELPAKYWGAKSPHEKMLASRTPELDMTSLVRSLFSAGRPRWKPEDHERARQLSLENDRLLCCICHKEMGYYRDQYTIEHDPEWSLQRATLEPKLIAAGQTESRRNPSITRLEMAEFLWGMICDAFNENIAGYAHKECNEAKGIAFENRRRAG